LSIANEDFSDEKTEEALRSAENEAIELGVSAYLLLI
jgi:hypothetical protein